VSLVLFITHLKGLSFQPYLLSILSLQSCLIRKCTCATGCGCYAVCITYSKHTCFLWYL